MQRSAKRLVRLSRGNHRARENRLLVVHLGRRRDGPTRHGRGCVRDLLDVIRREETLSTVDLARPPVCVRLFDYFDYIAYFEREVICILFGLKKDLFETPRFLDLFCDLHHRCKPRRRELAELSLPLEREEEEGHPASRWYQSTQLGIEAFVAFVLELLAGQQLVLRVDETR